MVLFSKIDFGRGKGRPIPVTRLARIICKAWLMCKFVSLPTQRVFDSNNSRRLGSNDALMRVSRLVRNEAETFPNPLGRP